MRCVQHAQPAEDPKLDVVEGAVCRPFETGAREAKALKTMDCPISKVNTQVAAQTLN